MMPPLLNAVSHTDKPWGLSQAILDSVNLTVANSHRIWGWEDGPICKCLAVKAGGLELNLWYLHGNPGPAH